MLDCHLYKVKSWRTCAVDLCYYTCLHYVFLLLPQTLNLIHNSFSFCIFGSPIATIPVIQVVTRCPAMPPVFIVMRSGTTVETGLSQNWTAITTFKAHLLTVASTPHPMAPATAAPPPWATRQHLPGQDSWKKKWRRSGTAPAKWSPV